MTKTILFEFLILGNWDLFVIWPACAKPLRRRQVLEVWCLSHNEDITKKINT